MLYLIGQVLVFVLIAIVVGVLIGWFAVAAPLRRRAAGAQRRLADERARAEAAECERAELESRLAEGAGSVPATRNGAPGSTTRGVGAVVGSAAVAREASAQGGTLDSEAVWSRNGATHLNGDSATAAEEVDGGRTGTAAEAQDRDGGESDVSGLGRDGQVAGAAEVIDREHAEPEAGPQREELADLDAAPDLDAATERGAAAERKAAAAQADIAAELERLRAALTAAEGDRTALRDDLDEAERRAAKLSSQLVNARLDIEKPTPRQEAEARAEASATKAALAARLEQAEERVSALSAEVDRAGMATVAAEARAAEAVRVAEAARITEEMHEAEALRAAEAIQAARAARVEAASRAAKAEAGLAAEAIRAAEANRARQAAEERAAAHAAEARAAWAAAERAEEARRAAEDTAEHAFSELAARQAEPAAEPAARLAEPATEPAPSVDIPTGPVTGPLRLPQQRDDLKEIVGIGPVIAGKLQALGVTSFLQLADLGEEDRRRVGETLGDLVEPDDLQLWAVQARLLAVRSRG